MEKVEKLEELYKRKFNMIPDGLHQEIGHCNVFRLEPFVGEKAKPTPYKKRDYYKVSFVVGRSLIHYADRVIPIEKQALVFSNPQIPYQWEHTESIRSGYFCVFNQGFFHQFGNLDQYSVFQPNGNHAFDLEDEELPIVEAIFEKMLVEINSDYIHKYDLMRNLIFELLHFAMKKQPSSRFDKQPLNASQRISMLFMELLERQFPIDETHQKIQLRSASDFAGKLAIHVNHLNRAVKEITLKTTSELIAERILQEAKILLRHSAWSVTEIAYGLGFNEITHFNNFFKKHVELSPVKYRNS